MGSYYATEHLGQFGNIARAGTTMVLPANAADVGSMIALAMNVIGKGRPETAAR